MIAAVDKNTCIGCGTCPAVCPEVFEMGEDGFAIAYTNPVPDELEESAQEAAEECPVDAIHVN